MTKLWGSVTFDNKELEDFSRLPLERQKEITQAKFKFEMDEIEALGIAFFNRFIEIKRCNRIQRCFRKFRSRAKRRF